MVRWVIGVLCVSAAAMSVWWWVAATGLERAISEWFDARRTDGWQAEVSAIDVAGFPARLDLTLQTPALADPVTGVAVHASQLDLQAPAYWPGFATLRFPQDAILVATPIGAKSVLADTAQVDLRLEPGTALEVQSLSLTSGTWIVSDAEGEILRADGLTLSALQSGETAYDITVDAPGLLPGDARRARLRIPEDWPLTFDQLALDMSVSFDRAWDIRALEDRRPQPRAISIRSARAAWGEVQIQAVGDLAVDEAGIPSGTLSLQARNWQQMLAVAEATGVLPGGIARQVERGLSALAGLSGNPNAIDVELTYRGGTVFAGFLPLGPAPRLVLR